MYTLRFYLELIKYILVIIFLCFIFIKYVSQIIQLNGKVKRTDITCTKTSYHWVFKMALGGGYNILCTCIE